MRRAPYAPSVAAVSSELTVPRYSRRVPSIPGIDAAYAALQARSAASLMEAAAALAGAAVQVAASAGAVASVAVAAAGSLAGEAAAGVSGAARGGVDLVTEARETVQAFHRLAVRADTIVAELEEPLLALGPGLRRLAVVLDDPVVSDLPATLRQVQDDVLPVLRTLAETHERVAFIAGQTERIMTFVDDTGRSLAGLPGAALLGRRRPAARVITIEQDPPVR